MRKKGRTVNKNDLSRKRRHKRKSKFYLVMGVLFLFLAGIVLLARLPALQIKEIKISETKRVPSSVLKEIVQSHIKGNYFGIFPKSNFMLYPKNDIKEEIMTKLPALLEAEVDTEIDRNLYIRVNERLASALWCSSSSNCFYMDEQGFIFARAMNMDGLMKYYGLVDQGGSSILGKSYGEVGFFSELRKFTENVESLGFRLERVNVVSESRAELHFSTGSYLLFLPDDKNKEELFGNIKLFIENSKASNGGVIPPFEYIDARYGNKIFFKVKEGV
ncbi:MAG TPA: hypothetical protein VJH67_00495 [Candidatus Paceibacterota bacterium]